MTRRWIVELIGEETFEALSRSLSGSELQSVLLEAFATRAGARSPADVLAQYMRDPFTDVSPVELRRALALDLELFEAARDFAAIELSPVAPLGACSTVAPTDQRRVLSALRSTELVADPTNVLALECARELLIHRAGEAHLATSQRVIRAQAVPPVPGFSQHFRIFVLASSALERKDHGFTIDALVRHAETMLRALDRLEKRGYSFGARRIDILATEQRSAVGDKVAERLGALATRKPLDHEYYSGGVRYMLWATTPDGQELPIADGGSFDWVAKLASNRRAAYVASGLGAQLVAQRFRSM
ncbi:MAG: hypothetical protein JNK05_14935 [Myxococcales bacterium]|nr:hypothetical protein [Myxococcales bacterium]